MQSSDSVLAILVSDLHLSEKPPRCRSAEPDWWEAQARQLDELSQLQKKYDCDVIIAGDIFDKWNASPELINFAIKHFPNRAFAIPGNHDLPNHDREQEHRSAYGTLAATGVINLASFVDTERKFSVHPFPWTAPIQPIKKPKPDWVHLAVVHAYIWNPKKPKTGYMGAPSTASVASFANRLRGYTVAHFGDNHISFSTKTEYGTKVFNPGTFYKRSIVDQQPGVYGVLYADGHLEVTRVHSISKDITVETGSDPLEEAGDVNAVREFVRQLEKSSDVRFDFAATMKQYLETHDVSARVQRLLQMAIDPSTR